MNPQILKGSDNDNCILEQDCNLLEEEKELQFPIKLEELLALLSRANKQEMENFLTREFYKDKKKIEYDPLTMLKASVCFHLRKEERLTRFYEKLKEDEAFTKSLGFETVPSYQQLWHFMNIRIKTGELCLFLTKLLQKEKKDVGRIRVQDATFVASRHEQAEYNGYYKNKGYKLEISSDRELIVPLYSELYPCNEYEGNYSVPFQEQLKFLNTEISCYDGGYNSAENYGMISSYYNVEGYFNIDQNTRIDNEVDENKIKEEYNKFWKTENYKENATLQEMMKFLCLKGKAEVVGRYFRNKRLKEREENKEGFEKKLHNRSLAETVNSILKEDTNLQKRVRNMNVNKARITSLWTIFALQLVSLVKLEKGILRSLCSLKGIVC